MELKELMEKIPPRSMIRIYKGGAPICTTVDRFTIPEEGDEMVLETQHCTVIGLEYNCRALCYDIVVEPVVLNIDKLRELFPFAGISEVSKCLMCLDFDSGTTLTKKWLYSPYNREEGKGED